MNRYLYLVFIIVIALVTAGVTATSARAKTYYIDPNHGGTGNDGSAENPWYTLEDVMNSNKIRTVVMPGDTLLLRSGYHGSIDKTKFVNSDYITIKAEEGQKPVLSRLYLQGCQKWRIEGLIISPQFATVVKTGHIVQLSNTTNPSREMELANCTIYTVSDASDWTGTDWAGKARNAVWASSGTAITIRDNVIRNIYYGIVMYGDSLTATGNTINGFIDDGIHAGGSDITITHNLISNLYSVNDAHSDGVQIYRGASVPHTNITISDNRIVNYTPDRSDPYRGQLQGIGCFDGPNVGFVVDNNIIISEQYHGISIYDAQHCKIFNNTVVDIQPDDNIRPWITVKDDRDVCIDCQIVNNLSPVLLIPSRSDIVARSNITVSDPGSMYRDAAGQDVRLKAGSPAIDTGDSILVSQYDIDGVLRPQGNGYDIGAYEYINSRPVIESVTIRPDSGFIALGDSVYITVVAEGNVAGLTPSDASFNGRLVPLEDMGDGTYTGLYIVDINDSPNSNVEALGITLMNADGLISEPAASHGSRLQIEPDSVSVEQDVSTFSLHQNYPNPFNGSTTISFVLPGDAGSYGGDVRITIYALSGQKVRDMVWNGIKPGVHIAIWNGRDDNGNPVATGVYEYRLISGDFTETRKMILLK